MSTEKVMTIVPQDLALTSDIEYPTDVGKASLPAGAALMREFLAHSPFVGHLGMRLEAIHPDAVRVSMPYRPELATVGDLVHRGAITSLVDTSAMAAATVRRRGRQLCFCDVDVADGHGRLVARGLVTYKLGGTR